MADKWGLSTDQLFNMLPPEYAAIYAQKMKQMFDEELSDFDPDERAKLMGFFDVPMSLDGITAEREHKHQMAREVMPGGMPMTGPLSTPMGKRVAGAVSRGAAGLAGAGPDATTPPPETVVDMPLVGEQDPLQFAATIGMALTPFIKGLQVARGIPALAKIASPVGRSVATMGTAGAGVETMRQGTAAAMSPFGTEPDWAEIPIAAGSFAAGGMPVGRLLAASLQAGASASLQKVFKGKVDPNRVVMEALFAGLFGNPRMKDLRAQMYLDTPPKTFDAVEEVMNKSFAKTQKGKPKTIVDQIVEEGDHLRAKHVDDLSKAPEEVLDTLNQAGEPTVAATIRDATAQKDGKAVITTDAPAQRVIEPSPGTPKQPPLTARIANMLKEHGELNTEQLTELLGVPRERIWRSLRTLEEKGGGRLIKEAKGEFNAQHYRLSQLGEGYAAKVSADKRWNWRGAMEDDLSRQAAETSPDYTEGMDVPARQAADQENAGLIRALESMDDMRDVDLAKYSPDQMNNTIDTMIGGRALDDLYYDMKSATDLPPEWLQFRDLIDKRITESVKPKPVDAEIETLVSKIEQSGEVRAAVSDAATRKLSADDPDGVKDVAGHYNLRIEEIRKPSGKIDGYKVLRMGSRTRDMGTFNTMDDLIKRIETIQRGEINNFDDAFIQAKNAGLKLTYAGKKGAAKSFRLSDPEHGAQVELKDLDAVRDALQKHRTTAADTTQQIPQDPTVPPEPPVAPPDEVTQALETEFVGPRMSVPGSDSPVVENGGWEVPPDPNALDVKVGAWTEFFSPKMDLFQKLDDLLGHSGEFNMHRDIWQRGHEANAARNEWSKPFEKQMNKILSGIPYRKWDAMQEVFVSGRKDYARMSKEFGLSKHELASILKMRNWYKELLSKYYDVHVTEELLDRFIEGGLVPLRDARGNPAALQDYAIPAEFDGLLDSIFDGTARLESNDIMSVADHVLRSLSGKRFIRPALAEIETGIKGIRSRKSYTKDQTEIDLLNQADLLATQYKDAILHRPDQAAAQAANRFQEFMYGGLKKFGLVRGDELAAQDIQRISMMMSSWFSGTVMSFRQALTLRNLWQPMLAAPKVGAGRVLHGWSDAAKAWKSGEMQELVRSGVVSEPAFFGFGSIAGARQGGTLFQAQAGPGVGTARQLFTQGAESTERVLRQIQSYGLMPFRGADQLNRVVTYFAGKRAILEELHWLQKGDLDTFRIKSGLAGDSRTFQNRILKMLEKGQTEQAAIEYGKHVSRSTQYLYGKAEVPNVAAGTAGRALMQFGVWPMSWHAYASRQTGSYSGIKDMMLTPKDWYAKWGPKSAGKYARTTEERYRALFTARYVAQGAALVGAGAALGIDTSSWNRANPLNYHGGPALQLISDLATIMMQTGPEFQRSMARSNITRFFQQAMVPAGAFLTDIGQAVERMNRGEEPWLVLAEALGFTIPE